MVLLHRFEFGNIRFARLASVLLLLLFSCNGDSVPDCFQNSGDLVRAEVLLAKFDKITVFENVRLVLRADSIQKVEIETGEFLREEVSAEVQERRLILKNTNNCNLFREYGLTTVYVSSPNITEIRSSTGLPIQSEGTLNYPELLLISESFLNPEAATTSGSFELQVDSENLDILVNGIAFFSLSGDVDNFMINVAAGDSRIEAEMLFAQKVTLNHRGTNDILINPRQSLTGIIRGTGDVVSYHRPDTVEVEVLFRGQLIFQD